MLSDAGLERLAFTNPRCIGRKTGRLEAVNSKREINTAYLYATRNIKI